LVAGTVAAFVSRSDPSIVSDWTKFAGWCVAGIGFVFQAGILYALFMAMKKDLNGLGGKFGRIQDEAARRYLRTCLFIILEGVPEEKRAEYLAKINMLV
jgi:hypothetical protein